ncbi:MAG: OmpA family protein [Aquabacterium sp.]|nr:OmpA family protein [Aquabacterium sp.]
MTTWTDALRAFSGRRAWTAPATRRTLAIAWMMCLSACQTNPPAPTARLDALPLEQAVAVATDSLAAQTQKLPAFLARIESLTKRPLLLDPSLDAATGQQTTLTHRFDQLVTDRLRARHAQFDVLPFRRTSVARAQLLLVGSITRHEADRQVFQLHLALLDLKSGAVVAQASSRARDAGFDTTPTPYYRDTPVLLVKDPVVEGYLRTTQASPGQPADAAYLQRVAAVATIQEATGAYDAARYQEALGLYRDAARDPAGEQMRALNGVYLTNWKLGHTAEAEQAFGQMVALGLANRALGVKFLFNPNSTEFWSDPKISGPYNVWLRQIARQAAAGQVCMDVIGHTSRTGSETYNDRLSAQRAAAIQRRLEQEAPALAGRMKPSGVGYRENLVGTGTDDASDALDRRVEFRITGC